MELISSEKILPAQLKYLHDSVKEQCDLCTQPKNFHDLYALLHTNSFNLTYPPYVFGQVLWKNQILYGRTQPNLLLHWISSPSLNQDNPAQCY